MGVKTTNNSSKRIKKILKQLENLKKPLKKISMDMKNQTLKNFDNEESYLGEKWKKSNRARKEGGKTLQDKRHLYRSINSYSDNNVARVGTNIIYGKVLNQGVKKGSLWKGEVTVKAHYRRIKYRKKNGEWAKNKRRILIKSHRRKAMAPWGDVPAYNFLGISTKMKLRYKNILFQHILKK